MPNGAKISLTIYIPLCMHIYMRVCVIWSVLITLVLGKTFSTYRGVHFNECLLFSADFQCVVALM